MKRGKMIKLVVVDLDGTLLTSDKKVSDGTLKAIKAYHERGIKFAICTGRSLIETTHISEIKDVFEHCDYVITANGGTITSLKQYKRVYSYFLPKSKIREVYDSISDMDNLFEVFIDGKVFCDESRYKNYKQYIHGAFYTMVEDTRIPVKDIMNFVQESDGKMPMLFISFKDEPTRNKAFSRIEKIEDISPHLSWTKAIEIGVKGVDKGESTKKLSEIIGVEKDEILFIGDSYNDLPMRKAVDILVAMGNAIDELKDLADFVTCSNDDDGVVYALDKYLND